MNKIGLYVHIPFCESKCKYCNFVSGNFSRDNQEKYIDTLIKEINSYKIQNNVSTIFFGGGTPSILTAEDIEKIILAIKNNFKTSKNVEITIECNPNSVSLEKLKKSIVNSNILKTLFPNGFTIPEIQKTYEAILNKSFDRRNFRRKLLSLGLIYDTNKEINFEGKKPAKLYKFKEEISNKNVL